MSEIRTWLVEEQIVEDISVTTVWRWLHQDALRPWYYSKSTPAEHRSWLFPRDPQFLEKASRVLDLYHRTWQGKPLGPNDYVISADEKSQLQALGRSAETLPPVEGHTGRFEFEYERNGTLAYLAALDVFAGTVFGRVDSSTGIQPFNQLVHLVMQQEPYNSADHVFWLVDNGSSHHPSTFPDRLQGMYSNAIAVMLPTHASWLNQIELFFSILQRKALTPNDFQTLLDLANRILRFQEYYNLTTKPFNWNFSKADLEERMENVKVP